MGTYLVKIYFFVKGQWRIQRVSDAVIHWLSYEPKTVFLKTVQKILFIQIADKLFIVPKHFNTFNFMILLFFSESNHNSFHVTSYF